MQSYVTVLSPTVKTKEPEETEQNRDGMFYTGPKPKHREGLWWKPVSVRLGNTLMG